MRGLSRRQIRTLFDVGTVAGLTDGQLLERFATRRDEGAELAFAALVERHGPMVLHACRGILRDDHEAMDVFQATFLVLARKGGTLWVRDSLGPWLHRVACRAASRARSAAARRRRIETRVAEMAQARGGGGGSDNGTKELAAVIHEEVDRLPERYREPIVLCDLEGRTCEEAARHLGCPVGTIGTRLARGRQRLRDRLQRRGLAPNASLLAAAMRWQGTSLSGTFPAELVGTTSRAAVQFISIGAATHGVAASLALGVLRSMAMTHWLRVGLLLLLTSASASGVVAFAGKDAPVAEPRAEDPPEAEAVRAGDVATSVVKPGRLRVNLVERGSLEASRNPAVFSMVEGTTTILSILPEGTRVKKGQLVCELDSAGLKDQLANQSIATQGHEAAYRKAKLTREVAEIALEEYESGIYPREIAAARGRLALAQSVIAKAEARIQRTRTARDRLKDLLAGQGERASADVLAVLEVEDRLEDAELGLDRERLSRENAENQRVVLEKFTYPKTVKQLRNDVEKARSSELTSERSWELEKKKLGKLELQVASCQILAPGDGLVVYANDPSRFGGSPPQIEEGAVVRERQKLFSIPDLDGPFQVHTKVQEALIDNLRLGLQATIKVDAFPDQTFTGVVEEVAPLPDPSSIVNPTVKVYTTRVSIAKGVPGLRPGMTAAVDIQIADLENVLTIPSQALVWYDQRGHVAVKTADGKIDWREVTVGLSDGKRIEVKEGLKSGEAVVNEPAPFLSEEQKRQFSKTLRKPTARSKARARNAIISTSLRAKLQAMAPEDRAKLERASPEEREAILKKAGLTDEELRVMQTLRGDIPTP